MSFTQHACYSCQIIKKVFTYNYLTESNNEYPYIDWFIAVFTVQTLSFALEALAAYLIFSNRSLQSHPYKLIAFMLLMDSAFNFTHDLEKLLCFHPTLWTQAMTTLLFRDQRELDIEDMYTSKTLQYYTGVYLCSNSMFYLFFRYTYYNVNICLAHDLIRTVQDPFESGEVRLRRLLPLSFTFFFIFLAWWLGQNIAIAMGIKWSALGYENPPCSAFVFR